MFSNIRQTWTKIFKLSNTEGRALIKITVFLLLLYIVMISTTIFETPEESTQPSNQTSKSENKTTKILLLAYARSGSSFTGELLSADDNAAYFFEPFYVFMKNIKAARHFAKNTMESIFGCADQTINNLKNHKWQNNRVKPTPSQCKASNPRVIKAIRIHRANIEPWIYESDIKVVHLIRDPRGMLNSIAGGKVWTDELKDARFQCDRILDDIKLEETLPSHRYYRVRYEDLALNTASTLRKIYNFLGLEFTTSVNRKVEAHVHAENKDNLAVLSDAEKKRTGALAYYNTFKTSSFDPNSWRKKLPIERIRDIEESCKDLMAIAGYQTF